MSRSKNYAVNMEVKRPEQPHVKIVQERSQIYGLKGWFAFILVGMSALTMILCIAFLGGSKIFPIQINLLQGLIPIVKQGHLQVIPATLRQNTGIQSLYTMELPPQNITDTIITVDNLLESYPKNASMHYRDCWLENPSFHQPCFFNTFWFQEICNKSTGFGYIENNGTYSPCFILRLEQTNKWEPLPMTKYDLPQSMRSQYDPGFFQVECSSTHLNGVPYPLEIKMFPPKGFSHLYFPESNFDPKYYLAPAVAVRVDGIPTNKSITVQCSIIARNSMLLWDNGAFSINFLSKGALGITR